PCRQAALPGVSRLPRKPYRSRAAPYKLLSRRATGSQPAANRPRDLKKRAFEVIEMRDAAVRSPQGQGCGAIDASVLAQVDAVIERYRGKQGALIPVLHETQEIVGYLPRSVQSR